MAMTKEEEIVQGIKSNEKLIALNILLVIYLYQKRYDDAMEDIEELLNDPEMQIYMEHLLLKQHKLLSVIGELRNGNVPSLDKFYEACL